MCRLSAFHPVGLVRDNKVEDMLVLCMGISSIDFFIKSMEKFKVPCPHDIWAGRVHEGLRIGLLRQLKCVWYASPMRFNRVGSSHLHYQHIIRALHAVLVGLMIHNTEHGIT